MPSGITLITCDTLDSTQELLKSAISTVIFPQQSVLVFRGPPTAQQLLRFIFIFFYPPSGYYWKAGAAFRHGSARLGIFSFFLFFCFFTFDGERTT